MDRVFRRKPTFTTAIQFDGNNASNVMSFCARHLVEVGNKLVLETPDGPYIIECGGLYCQRCCRRVLSCKGAYILENL